LFKLFEHAYDLLNLIGHGVIMEGNRKMTGSGLGLRLSPDFRWALYCRNELVYTGKWNGSINWKRPVSLSTIKASQVVVLNEDSVVVTQRKLILIA